jgi:Ca2+-binding EF-hand superfamily protein
LNGDGVLSKQEMTRFVKKFLNPPQDIIDEVNKIVEDIFYDFDVNRSGNLDRKESLNFVNHILSNQGKMPASFSVFNSIF